MPSPTISVLMPVYNGHRYVGQAVESILGQTLGDFEFIIIDDGSTDGTREILEGYAKADPRIQLVSRPNTGYSVALNEALAKAGGEFIARMDADDVSMPQRFAVQVEYLRAHPKVLAVGSRVRFIDPEGADLCDSDIPTEHEAIDAAHMAGTGGIMPHPSLMVRRQAMLAVKGYHTELEPAEDLDLYLRLAERGRLANVAQVLLRYRQHPGSVSYSRMVVQRSHAEKAVRTAHQRRGLKMPADACRYGDLNLRAPDHHRIWAWWALTAGHVATARRHAFIALRQAPLVSESWRLMACTLRGR